MRVIQSSNNIWFNCLGGAMWLVGAVFSVCWMLRSGGLIWPAVAFSLWVTVLGLAFLIADSEKDAAVPVGGIVYKSLKCGAASGLVVLLGSLFVEFWPVTVSMACMFAVCRSIKGEDTPAYS